MFLTGLRIVIMNEIEATYYPVMDISISEVHFEKNMNLNKSEGKTCTSLSAFYYNAQIGEWEPFIENFRLFITMDTFSNKSCTTIKTDRAVNINLSDIVIQNISAIMKIWNNLKESKPEVNDDLFNNIDKYQNKEVDKYSVDDVMKRRNQWNMEQLDATDITKNKEDDLEEDLAAPVSIINLTGIPIFLKKLDEEFNRDSVYGSDFREPERVYLPIKVEFEGSLYPIPKIELSKLHTGSHLLTDDPEDEVYYGVHLNKMQKILTVRSYYTIHNRTIFAYVIRVYNSDMTTDDFVIEPDEKLPILKSMQGHKCSLSIATNDNWSQTFDPIDILNDLAIGKDKTFIAHDMEYTFLSKSFDPDVEICCNLNLLAPVIVRNCLPFNIDVKVPSRKDRDYYILKGDHAYFLSYDLKDSFEMDFKIDGYEYSKVKIDPFDVGNEIKVKFKDIEGVDLTLFIKVERERAGFEFILYSKILIMNYTGLNFDMFTSSKSFRKRVSGQKTVSKHLLMTEKASKLIINYKGASSGKLKTKQIGYKDDFKIKVRDEETKIASIYDFVFSTSLNLVTNETITSDLFCKNIKISPKYVIVNHLDTPLKY